MILGTARRYLVVLGIALIGISSLAAGWQYRRANDLQTELGVMETALVSTRAAIGSLVDQRDADLAELGSLRDDLLASRRVMSEAIEELEELKRNEAMVQADPVGAAERINQYYDRLFIELACASGAIREDCEDTTAPAGATEQAGP